MKTLIKINILPYVYVCVAPARVIVSLAHIANNRFYRRRHKTPFISQTATDNNNNNPYKEGRIYIYFYVFFSSWVWQLLQIDRFY